MPALLAEPVIGRMRSRLDKLVRQAVAAWAADPGQEVVERGVVHGKLHLADPDFALCCEHPVLAEAAIEETVLIYSSTGGRPRVRRMTTELTSQQRELHELFCLQRSAPRT